MLGVQLFKHFHFNSQSNNTKICCHQLKYHMEFSLSSLLHYREFSVANIIALVEQHVMIFCSGELDSKIPQEWTIHGILDLEVTAMQEIFALKVLGQ